MVQLDVTDAFSSAGITDSALTNHGMLQARHLGIHLATRFRFTHVFSSDLKRAFKTAVAVQEGQMERYANVAGIRQLRVLQEQNFGSYERKPFGTRDKTAEKPTAKSKPGPRPPDFQEAESKASLARRADRFLDEYLVPIIRETKMDREREVAVISHGILLSALWKCLLRRFALHSVTVGQGVDIQGGDVTTLEHLGAWANTGYLELNIQFQQSTGRLAGITEILIAEEATTKDIDRSSARPNARSVTVLYDWKMTVRAVNCRDHLRGLKRTGGGVGSSKHDESQKNIDTFFKKQKTR